MFKENSKILVVSFVGAIAGVMIVFGAIFAFFTLMDKINEIKITCLPQEETKEERLICRNLEIIERGNVLKKSDIISPPEDEKELQKIEDKTTSGRFVEVKIEIENLRKDSIGSGEIFLIDEKGRKFYNFYEAYYWLPKGLSEISPGLKKELRAIFEVPADSSGFKTKAVFWNLGGRD